MVDKEWLAWQAIADQLYKHRVPGDAQNVKPYPNLTNEHFFFIFFSSSTTAEVNKAGYIMKLSWDQEIQEVMTCEELK